MKTVKLLNNVLQHTKNKFVGKDEIIDLLGVALVAKENAFLLGPPGTAKSALVRSLSKSIRDGKNFEYLLTKFTEPNELFGPLDIRKLKEGELKTNVEGMLPEASLVFLDEVFNANSAILNSLLTALNEKIFRRGKETTQLPALMFVGASNLLPSDEALEALFDRFLIRVRCGYVSPELLSAVLQAGRNLEKANESEKEISIKEIIEIQKEARKVDLAEVIEPFVSLVHSIRNAGITVTDRTAVKIQNIIAASAILSERNKANVSDLWVCKYIWTSEEQIEILEGLVNAVIESKGSDNPHPQAFTNQAPDPESLFKEIGELKASWNTEDVTLQEKSVIKDKLRHISGRAEWITDAEQKEYVKSATNELWKQVLEE